MTSPAPFPENEPQRLTALRRYSVLDTPPEECFDRITRLAVRHFKTPIALISLVDEGRQWFKAKCGLEAEETGRDIAFCSHAILEDDVMIVPNALEDPRFAENPLVTGSLQIRFYAGAPLIGADGSKIGTVCLIDQKPRYDFDESDKAMLKDLAAIVIDELEMRAASTELMADAGDNRAFLSAVLENIDEGVVACDVNGEMTLCNRAMREFYSTDGKPLPQNTWAVDFDICKAGEDRPLSLDELPLWKALKGEPTQGAELVIMRGDAPQRHVQTNARPMIDADGNMIGAVASMHDITQNKFVERQLIQAQKMEAVGQLTGGLAHDFNNLLAVILGNLQLLELLHENDEKSAKRIASALEAVRRGSELTKRLLVLSRKHALQTSPVKTNELILGMEDMIKRTIGERTQLKHVLCDTDWIVEVDANQLETTILNLAVNARDAMSSGGQLTIETQEAYLDDSFAALHPSIAPGEYLQISVSDNGCGMSPETAQMVFEPFFTTKEAGKGTGLGLSMVYGFVKQSNGHVSVYSEVNKGTSVKLFLPRSRQKAAQNPASSTLKTAETGAEKILVVEDQEDVRDIAVGLLNDLGYSVIEAKNGKEGFDILASNADVDLLFTDLIMPGGMDGAQLARTARKARPDLPVLFTTGYADAAILRNGGITSSSHLVTKPYSRYDLATKVRDALNAASGGERARTGAALPEAI